MGFIEYHKGCEDFKGCFGPRNDWITIFDVNLGFFIFLLFFGFMLALTTYYIFKKNQIFETKKAWRYVICGLIILIVIIIGRMIFLGYTRNIFY